MADVDDLTAEAREMFVYWCPRCNVQSSKPFHFCRKGPALIPQLDEETQCERIAVVPAAALESAEERAARAQASARRSVEEHNEAVRELAAAEERERELEASYLKVVAQADEQRDVAEREALRAEQLEALAEFQTKQIEGLRHNLALALRQLEGEG